MKLNEDWDQVYRSATLRLQHRLEALELENSAIKQLNNRLLLKVEHQQVNASANTPPPHNLFRAFAYILRSGCRRRGDS